MDPRLVIAIVLIGLFAAFMVGTTVADRRRREALRAVAERLGWAFAPGDAPPRGGLPLFSRGRRQRMRNRMSGTVEDLRVSIYDHAYTVGGGKNSRTYRQTVVDFEIPGLRAPAFVMQRERFGHRLVALFGFGDVDLPRQPELSRQWHLKGADAAAIRAFFGDDELAAFIAGLDEIAIEALGDRLLVYRPGRRAKPEQIDAGLAHALEIALAFAARTLPDPA